VLAIAVVAHTYFVHVSNAEEQGKKAVRKATNYSVGIPDVTPSVRDINLEVFVLTSIDIRKPKISDGRKILVAKTVIEVAEEVFPEDRDSQESWVSLIAVESGFDGKRISKTGAIGLGQIIPRYRNDFATACGLPKVDEGDLKDDRVNATLSACLFRSLVTRFAGNHYLALIAYNQGAASGQVRSAEAGKKVTGEAATYVKLVKAHLKEVTK
jgi:hypothetical protein